MLAKNDRVAGLVSKVGKLLNIDKDDIKVAEKAGKISKADLATQMVVEMTSLQGTMGREYALREGHPEEVATAIYEHWLPRSAGDQLPQTTPGTLLAITDKMDSLVGLFAAGLAPKSTSDPFGLRRAALGVVQILINKEIDVDLREVVKKVAKAQPIILDDKTTVQLMEFIYGRLDVWLDEELGARRDVINAVLAEQAHNPYRALQGVQQLSEWIEKDGWENLLDNFARCVRISRGEKVRHKVNPELFEDEQEKELYAAYEEAAKQLEDGGNVDAFLSAFQPMVPKIMSFFDAVMVNAEDKKVRNNRLGLMQAISDLQTGRADLSELAGF
jgi:glycyl-tRNA synthetase